VSDPSPGAADRAFLLASRAWGADMDRLPDRLAADWKARLSAPPDPPAPPAESLDRLRVEHQAHARPDLPRIHPSWWVRALQDESATVRRAVTAYGPEPIRERLRNELELSRDEVVPTADPHPDAVSCVLALWSEPLVGGPPLREDDPPIVAALAGLGRAQVTLLISLAGLAKLAAIPDAAAPSPATDRVVARLDALRASWQDLDPRLVQVARLDLARSEGQHLANLPRLGLITVGRLLGGCEPQRARWALQHLPYPIAKMLRPHMGEPSHLLDPDTLTTWESRVLAMALERLDVELADGGAA
jgi:hypothetical protein